MGLRRDNYSISVDEVHWPLIIATSAQGNHVHIIEPEPKPNGSWDALCTDRVSWTPVTTPEEASRDLCARCENTAWNIINQRATTTADDYYRSSWMQAMQYYVEHR